MGCGGWWAVVFIKTILKSFENNLQINYTSFDLISNALPVHMPIQVPKNGHFAREVLTFWVPFSGPFLADFWTHFGVDFGSICGARAGPRHHHRSAIFNEKTRGFRRGVQQNSRVLSCKKAVDKRFVETKSTPMHLLEKVSKTHGFCKDRCQNVQKPIGF